MRPLWRNYTQILIILMFYTLTSSTLSDAKGLPATPNAGQMTWEMCVEEGLANNPDIHAYRSSSAKAGAILEGSYSGFKPQVSGVISVSRQGSGIDQSSLSNNLAATDLIISSPLSPAAAPINQSMSMNNDFSYGVTVKQNLFAGFRDEGAVEKRQADLHAAEADLKRVMVQFAFDLKNAFAQQLYFQELIDVTAKVTSRRSENVRLVEMRFQNGRENKGSELRSEAAFLQAKFENAQAKRGLEAAKQQLAKALGRARPPLPQVRGSLDFDGKELLRLSSDFKDIIKSLPAHQVAEWQATSAQASIKTAKSEFSPELNAVGSVGRSGRDWAPGTNQVSVGLTLTVPLYLGGSNFANVKTAVNEKARADAARESIDLQLLTDLAQSRANLLDGIERVVVQSNFLKAAEVRAQIGRNQYTLGLLLFDEWDTIENDLVTTQKNLLLARRDAFLARASWEKAIGKGL